MSLANKHRTLSLSPLAQKRKTAVLRLKIALYLKEVCYKVSLCEYCQRQSCKVFTVLSVRAWFARRSLRENLAETDHPTQKRRFPINIRS